MPTEKNVLGLHTYNFLFFFEVPDLSFKNGHAKFCAPRILADTSLGPWHNADLGGAGMRLPSALNTAMRARMPCSSLDITLFAWLQACA